MWSSFPKWDKIPNDFVLFFSIVHSQLLAGFASAVLSQGGKKSVSRKSLGEGEDFLWEVDVAEVEVLAFGRWGCAWLALAAVADGTSGLNRPGKVAQEFGSWGGPAPPAQNRHHCPPTVLGLFQAQLQSVPLFSWVKFSSLLFPAESCSDIAVTCGKQQDLGSAV